MEIDLKELAAVPYLNAAVLRDRIVNLMSLWDGERWHTWLPHEGRLIDAHVGEAVDADYVA